MPTFILNQTCPGICVESFAIGPADVGLPASAAWSVTKRTLRGGRREGVELIEIDNGAMALLIVPTRGMGIWNGRYHGDAIGWRSPVTDGPIHPSFVNLSGWGGLGWLDGFDEMLVRCGLEHNGAPYEEKAAAADGSERHVMFGLHGRIANIPAHFVEVRIDEQPEPRIIVRGQVDEVWLFGPRLRLHTTIETAPGANWFRVRDEIENLRDVPAELELLYHWNFGPPHLEEGARFVAPVRAVCPRDKRAQEGLGHYDVYAGPEPGYAEQVYFFDLVGEGTDEKTLAMLGNRAGDKAIALRFAKRGLPYFTLWKNTGGLSDGYVTGLEPGTNYPNPKPFERDRGRVILLKPGGRHVAETVLEAHDTGEGVAKLEAEIKALQSQASPVVHPKPLEPFAYQAS